MVRQDSQWVTIKARSNLRQNSSHLFKIEFGMKCQLIEQKVVLQSFWKAKMHRAGTVSSHKITAVITTYR